MGQPALRHLKDILCNSQHRYMLEYCRLTILFEGSKIFPSARFVELNQIQKNRRKNFIQAFGGMKKFSAKKSAAYSEDILD